MDQTFTLPEHLANKCSFPCDRERCPDAVRQETLLGRWFITIGHAGFNTRANNGMGYATWQRARQVVNNSQKKGGR